MEQEQPGSPAMRVSIVSASRNQREHLKRLIEKHGPRVVGMSGFRDYDLAREEQHPDVLLVDLDQADDSSLTRIGKLLEQSKIPVLFNESTAVPTAPGPYRDNWVDHLIGKLYNLAAHRNLLAKTNLSDRPRYAQAAGSHTLPKVLIVAHSKTRRRVLQIILAAQGIKNSTEISFEPNFITKHIEHYDALLVDEHNVGPDEQRILSELTTQTHTPVQVCNSSTIPYSALARRKWGIQLAGKIIKISKLEPASPPVASAALLPSNMPAYNNFVHISGDHEWGNRLSAALAQVRSNLAHQASAAKNCKPAALKTPKVTTAPPSTDEWEAGEVDTLVTDKSSALITDTAISLLIDANSMNMFPNSHNGKATPEDARDNEIERFFDFDQELDIAQQHQTLEDSQLLNLAATTHDEVSTWNNDAGITNPFSKHPSGQVQKQQRSRWRDSLSEIRKKLPRLFH